ncbi:glycosyltransferase [Pedobacter mucosus]|uniref:glycosyltransferase n=1 Tax=Pedobacter mucosus TaxID=2895286 RepID=UPI001EE45754|nr:glycosyltransferase [Pedobacter mucosus]UKT64385.1 glycosyltransferase [Pedobacter mucosus]
MAQKEDILFITDKKYIDYEIAGGVQICTREFLEYFEGAGYNVIVVRVLPTITLMKRLKLKLGIEAYELYDLESFLIEIVETINTNKIQLVLFNQLNIAHWAAKIREKISYPLKCIGLSHGNESGDYLHEITKRYRIPNIREIWRLGKLITKEKVLFTSTLDGVVIISEQERYIGQWLGAKKTLFLPRILKPQFINWKPENKVIGFVGTLDHHPNYEGIELFANHLQNINFDGTLKLVGGPSAIGEKFARKYSFISYRGQLSNDELPIEVSKWSIFVNPIFWYARGSSTKVSQFISWGIPILSTRAGIRGYHLANTNFLTKDDTPKNLSELVINSLHSFEVLSILKKISEENATKFKVGKWSSALKEFLINLNI